MYICIYKYVYVYTGLEISNVASQNANHFFGNCESLWQSESQNCESILGDLRITFQMVPQKTVFCPYPCFKQNFPLFRHILCT